jgi:hypothetical protein
VVVTEGADLMAMVHRASRGDAGAQDGSGDKGGQDQFHVEVSDCTAEAPGRTLG